MKIHDAAEVDVCQNIHTKNIFEQQCCKVKIPAKVLFHPKIFGSCQRILNTV